MPDLHLELPSPAKINHFLHICGRRDDGYHNLQTAFQFLDIADTLHFSATDNGQIKLHTAMHDIAQEDNLIIRAARALQQACHITQGADIHIEKRLPMGAGLGGGSSNAATTLIALNALWRTGLNQKQLKTLGMHLGADVPVFIHGHSAWAEGIGEKLTDIELDETWYLLVIPPCHASTAAIFSHSQLTRNSKMMKMAAFLEQGSQQLFRNDCEALVRKLHPEVNQALESLSVFGKARMTGTGACVFASFDDKAGAEKAGRKMPDTMQTLVSKSCNISPLHQALRSTDYWGVAKW